MKTISLFTSLIITPLFCIGYAQDQAGKTAEKPEKATSEAQDAQASPLAAREKEFEAAYAKGDAAAVARFFSEDAQYTTEDGRVLVGRPAIEQAFRESMKDKKGATLDITVNSVKQLSPEVDVENGQTTLTMKDGSTDSALFTSIQVKKDGQWLISQLTETDLPASTPHDNLTDLAWLLGAWEEADGDIDVNSSFNWARGENFLTQNVAVKKKDDTILEGWQIIGWDEDAGHIRSWTFDTDGGFAESVWTQDRNRWLVREVGMTPDGDRTTADNTITKLSDDKYSWESNNRTLDGEPQPAISRIEIKRAKGN
jgi:uncharacterized protein (TIGR02246 family)